MYPVEIPAEHAYQALVRQLPQMQSLFVIPYRTAPVYEDRLAEVHGKHDLLLRARARRDESGVPFWDAVIAEASSNGTIMEEVLDGALYHQDLDGNIVEISRDRVLSTGIVASVHNVGIKYPWAVLSRVRAKENTELHFPMLDFRCPISSSNLVSLQRAAERLLACPWALIESQKSYHLIGASLMTFSELVAFFGAAILLGPIVDRNYVAHQLINGVAALRIVGSTLQTGLRARCSTFPQEAWG